MAARGRFAPSPTGDLHLGSARTALAAWLAARSAGGDFVLRIEDLDQPRVVTGAEARIVEDLRWLGLDWDGAAERQSARPQLYRRALDTLIERGLAYPCFCSRADVAAASAPHGPSDDGPRYSGHCRPLSPAEVAARTLERKPSYRMRVSPETIVFVDRISGAHAEDVAARVGDFVLCRADGIFTYQLAVVVDDAAMGIDEVVRGDDLLSSTARQIALYRALGHTEPRFAHVPLALGVDGARLAKRHGAPSIRALREAGVSAERVVAVLARSLGLAAHGDLRAPDLVADFSYDKIARAPWVATPTAFDS